MENGNVLFLRNKPNKVEGANIRSDGVWDDDALVKAYDFAVTTAKKQLAQHMEINGYGEDKPNPPSSKTSKDLHSKVKFEVGSYCRAMYSEDGRVYEAVLKSIQPNGKYLVQYIGYGNEEEVAANELKPSKGQSARAQQQEQAALDAEYAEEEARVPEVVPQPKAQPGAAAVPPAPPQTEAKPPRNKFEAASNGRSQGPQFGSQFPTPPAVGSFPPVLSPLVMPAPPPETMFSRAKTENEALTSMLLSWYMSGFHTGYYEGFQEAGRRSSQSPK